ncbi:MAG: LamG domain-containing protein, partial [Thermoguttaceae bacterium]|nr:LamG domain-containing protein [Thermoguttaceae bacterium]
DNGVQGWVNSAYIATAYPLWSLPVDGSGGTTATATVIKEPVFVVDVGKEIHGATHGGGSLAAKLHGSARATDGEIDLRQDGHVSFAHDERFDLGQPLSIECRVWFDEPGNMPVVISCGSWNQAGWFLQRIGGTWRWHVGGIDCDGGRPVDKQWIHVIGVYDGRAARLYVDGKLVAEKAGPFNQAAWPGELCVGQYSAQPGPPYQVRGRVAGVKLYHRAVQP